MAAASLTPTTRPYRRRHPEKTPLYRILNHYFPQFRSLYAQRYQAFYGPYRGIISATVASYLHCGILRYGFTRLKCPTCLRELLVPFSCRRRYFCPSCHAKRVAIMVQEIQEKLIAPVPHVHLVFTIPRRLRYFFRRDRSLLGKLSRVAYQSIREVLGEVRGERKAVPGAIISVHTAGNLLNFHPHLHALVTRGVFSADGAFLPVSRIPSRILARVFAHHLLAMLKGEGKIDERTIQKMQAWKHSGFNVDVSLKLNPSEPEGLLRVLHYLLRPPFALGRMRVAGEKIIYRADKVHPGFGANFRIMEPVDFVAAVTGHIPDKGRHTVRRYGYYSNRSRGKRRLGGKGKLILVSPAAEEERELTRRWRKMLKRIYEVDPLICPHCGSYLAIIGFVSDAAGIRTTLRSLGLREEEEVPASARPPPELTYELLPQESLFPEELPVIFLN